MMRILSCTAAAVLAATAASAQAPPTDRQQCFFNRDYQAFKAVNDRKFIIRVNLHDYYEIGLKQSCPNIMRKDAVLITKVHGPDVICGPLDWELRVAESGEARFAEGCIVGSQRKLTPEEASALPPDEKP